MKNTLLLVCLCLPSSLLAASHWQLGEGFSLSTNSAPGLLGREHPTLADLGGDSGPTLTSLSLNKIWLDSSEWKLYSEHLFSSLSLQGNDGLLLSPWSLDASHYGISVNNRFSLSKRFSNALTLTPTISLNMGDELDLLQSLSNTSASLFSLNTAVDLDGLFSENWGYSADLAYHLQPYNNNAHGWRSEAMLFYQWQLNSRVLVGYKYSNGLYNSGQEEHVYPAIDFLWHW